MDATPDPQLEHLKAKERAHVKRRANQRLGVYPDDVTLDLIAHEIQTGQAQFVRRKNSTISIWETRIAGKRCWVYYSKKRHHVVTVVPPYDYTAEGPTLHEAIQKLESYFAQGSVPAPAVEPRGPLPGPTRTPYKANSAAPTVREHSIRYDQEKRRARKRERQRARRHREHMAHLGRRRSRPQSPVDEGYGWDDPELDD
jgi:hypothetical protein